MIIENIILHIRHKHTFNTEIISEMMKPLNHLFDEVITRPLNCVFSNENRGYRVRVSKQFIDFDLNNLNDKNIVATVLKAFDMNNVSKDMKITFLVSCDSPIKNFNNLFKNIPADVNSEFIGFRHSVNETAYYISMVKNMENNLSCRIGVMRDEFDLGEIEQLLDDINLDVDEKITPLIKHFIKEVI